MADRHQFRAKWHDYNGGIYFVTICAANKRQLFGKISNGHMNLSPIGNIVDRCILEIPQHTPSAEIWNYVVMPNHIHIIIAVGTRHGASACATNQACAAAPTTPANIGCLKPKRHEASEIQDFHHNSHLSVIIGQLKSSVKRETNKQGYQFAWQQRYHDHIIRNQLAFDNIMNYIDSNVENWVYDRFNPQRIDNADAPWRVPTSERHEA